MLLARLPVSITVVGQRSRILDSKLYFNFKNESRVPYSPYMSVYDKQVHKLYVYQ